MYSPTKSMSLNHEGFQTRIFPRNSSMLSFKLKISNPILLRVKTIELLLTYFGFGGWKGN